MRNGFAIDLLRKISDSPLQVDHVLPGQEFPWGWLKQDPVSPDLVGRWIKAGLIEDYEVGTIEDYEVGTMVLTNAGERMVKR